MSLPDLCASFRIPFTRPQGTTLLLTFTPIEEADIPPFPIPSQSIPIAISRALFIASPRVLTAVLPSLENQICAVFFHCSAEFASAQLQSAMAMLKASFPMPLSIATEIEIEIDAIKFQVAVEQYLLRHLESNGWWQIKEDAPRLLRGNSARDYALSNFTVKCAFSSAPGRLTGFAKAGRSTETKTELFVTIGGHVTFLVKNDGLLELGRGDQEKVIAGESVRIDSMPCSVLPNCSRAFAVRCKKNRALGEYWRFVHGLDIADDSVEFEVSFTPGDETVTLTYPSKCVLQAVPFREIPMRQCGERAEEFRRRFLKDIQIVVDAIVADFP
jgi:hypothetical protein